MAVAGSRKNKRNIKILRGSMKQSQIKSYKELADIQFNNFDGIITQSYLSQLSNCEIRDIPKPTSGVRWYQITKIVIEKDVFFGDKLSMLYISLHDYAQDVILVLNKDNGGNIELYLGARDFSGEGENCFYSGEILKSGMKGFLPGVIFHFVRDLPEEKYKNKSIASLSGLASLRDDKKENFVQGLERLINATRDIPNFRAYFVAENVSEEQARLMINAFSQIQTSLSPLEECQISTSESYTEGVSESVSKSISDSITKNISKTVTHSEGYNSSITESESKGNSTNSSPNIIEGYVSSIFGGEVGSGTSVNYGIGKQIGENSQNSIADQSGETTGRQSGIQTQKGTNSSETKGYSRQITYKNQQIHYYLDLIEDQIERIDNGIPFGLWSVATYFVAPNKTTALKLANLYRGCIIGEESNLASCAVNVWSEQKSVEKLLEILHNSLHPRFNYQGLDVSAGVTVTSKELAIHLSLPQSSVPGVLVREEQCFAPNVISTLSDDSNRIELGKIVHLGQENDNVIVNLDVNTLAKHTFVTGTTGSGKSNTLYLLLKGIIDKEKKFLVIEPAKGEYKHVFGNRSDVSVYSSNPNMNKLLRINPFEFPEGFHVYEHIDRLIEIFNACWPMYAAMPVVLKKAITDAYKQCGWDLYSSIQEINSARKLFPTVNDVVVALREFINNSEYSAETKGDYKGSLETRLISMSEGLTGMMLNNSMGNISDLDLFQENVIIDLSRIGNTETKALIMGLLIMKMNEFYQTQGKMNSNLNHITVLEEAHNLLKRTSTAQSQESSNLAGKSVEMICNSIAEMRTYGEGFIIVDQSPSQVDLAAIRNTNTKIILSLPEAEDRECAGKSIGLKDKQIDEIGRLKMGEAIVYQNDWEEPVQCKVKEFEYDKEKRFEGQKDSDSAKDGSKMLYDVLSFLYKYCGGNGDSEIQIDKIKNSIHDSRLLSATKFSLLKLLDDYIKNGVDLNKRNHAKVMETVGACLGLSPQIKKIIMKKGNITEANDSIKDLLTKLLPDGSDDLYRFCTRCSLRLLASESSTNVDFYNNWYRTYYK